MTDIEDRQKLATSPEARPPLAIAGIGAVGAMALAVLLFSANLYYENMHSSNYHTTPATTPTGVAVFAEDIAIRRYAETGNNIVHWSEFERGGHFAALEAPDLFVGDVRSFFRNLDRG